MKKIANQILYNLKKEKTSFISFGVIILITALILNCAAVLLCQVDRAYDTKFEKLSTAMLNAIVPEVQNSSELEKAIDEIEKVEKIESYTAIMTEATVKDFNGADFSMNTVFYNIDDKRTLNNYELVSESKNNVDDPIYIPLYVSNFGGFALNDEIVYAIDGKSHSFTVAGVIEEMQYGNYGSGLLCAYLPKEEFAELDLLSFVCVACILCGVVSFFTYISARKIKKTQPIDGLRGNTSSKHTKKNYFPFEETRGNTKFLLVLKQMIASTKQNIMLFLVSFVLTVLIAFSGTLFYNVVVEPDNFMSALSDEVADVIIYPKSDSMSELESKLGNDNRVQNSLKYMSAIVKIEEKTVTAFACEDFSKVRNDVCYMGENPKDADEIALGSAFEENFKIGDTVSVTVDGITKSFQVTGFVQSVNLQGELCELSIEGYNSLFNQNQTPYLYVYLENAENAEKITKEYKSDYSALVADTVNSYKLQTEAQDMYMGITVVLVVSICAVTILVVLFILYIVIKSLLVKRRQELGIYKAMGYTSSQLILQTTGSFMPVSMVAIVISSFLAIYYMPAIYQFIFETLGVMKNNIEISFGFLMLFAVAQILVNIMISIILCMPIRKISAYVLIKE